MANPRPSVAALTRDALTALAPLLSERDRAEVIALSPDFIRHTEAIDSWIDHIVHTLDVGQAWVVSVGDEPVAAGGLFPSPGRASTALSWCVGSPRKREAGALIFRIAAQIHRNWESDGTSRFQCTCLDSGDSSEWLVRLGYQREGRLRSHGRGGEDFLLWGRVYGR